MDDILMIVLLCGGLTLIYAIATGREIMSAETGNERMNEIAGAIQEGAKAYLNRQYSTISYVGVFVAVCLGMFLGKQVGIGFALGAVLSGLAGYIGMHVSVRANVRTTEAARKGLSE